MFSVRKSRMYLWPFLINTTLKEITLGKKKKKIFKFTFEFCSKIRPNGRFFPEM